MRSGKEVEKDLNKNKRVVDDNDGVEIEEVDIRSKDDEKNVKKGGKGNALSLKNDEPKVDVKTLPFPQRFIRRNLDK